MQSVVWALVWLGDVALAPSQHPESVILTLIAWKKVKIENSIVCLLPNAHYLCIIVQSKICKLTILNHLSQDQLYIPSSWASPRTPDSTQHWKVAWRSSNDFSIILVCLVLWIFILSSLSKWPYPPNYNTHKPKQYVQFLPFSPQHPVHQQILLTQLPQHRLLLSPIFIPLFHCLMLYHLSPGGQLGTRNESLSPLYSPAPTPHGTSSHFLQMVLGSVTPSLDAFQWQLLILRIHINSFRWLKKFCPAYFLSIIL